jgi:uncharacterized protein (TIGR04255 family)
MAATNLPKRLQKEPLIDAIFEIRFSAAVPAMPISSVLPGFFFAEIKGDKRIERLPMSEFPTEFRQATPDMRFHPLSRLHIDGYSISIGDESISVACKLPYRGWGHFKQKIIDICGILVSSSVVGKISRYSMRYINIIESIGEGIKRINLDIKLGNRQLENEPFQFRIETAYDDLNRIISLGYPASAKLQDGTTRNGVLVDIDVSCNISPGLPDDNISDQLEKIHKACKETFYECITGDAVNVLGPIYD